MITLALNVSKGMSFTCCPRFVIRILVKGFNMKGGTLHFQSIADDVVLIGLNSLPGSWISHAC